MRIFLALTTLVAYALGGAGTIKATTPVEPIFNEKPCRYCPPPPCKDKEEIDKRIKCTKPAIQIADMTNGMQYGHCKGLDYEGKIRN